MDIGQYVRETPHDETRPPPPDVAIRVANLARARRLGREF